MMDADAVARSLDLFCADARGCFGSNLLSITLYGSAAEDRLRNSSDVNVILVFRLWDARAMERFAPQLAFARAAARINAMFLNQQEIGEVVETFAQKFSDVHRRHKVLFGQDFFHDAKPSRAGTLAQLRQALLNLLLRMREAYAERAPQPDRLILTVAAFASPLRSCAATLRVLQGAPMLRPKEALEEFVQTGGGDTAWLAHISEAREHKPVSNEAAVATVRSMIETAQKLREAAGDL